MKKIFPKNTQKSTKFFLTKRKINPKNKILGQFNFHHKTKSFQYGKIVPFNLADIGEGIKEVEVKEWFIKEGDEIQQFSNICEVQSDKANVEITSRYDGIVKSIKYEVGQMAQVGDCLIEIELDDDAEAEEESKTKTVSSKPSESNKNNSDSNNNDSSSTTSSSISKILATPAVRRIIRENSSIDINKVKATGKNGRFLKQDLENYLTSGQQQQNENTSVKEVGSTKTKTASVAAKTTIGDRVENVKGMTRIMIKTMEISNNIPQFGFSEEYKFDNIITLKNKLKPIAAKRDLKISFMPFIIKATSMALKQYPILNSSLSSDKSQIIYHGQHNIGVAMDTPDGLLVPNIKGVQDLSLFDIAQELGRLQVLGHAGKLATSDLQGGTFTLSNIGTIGGTYAKPMIVSPEVCIGAIGKLRKLPVFDELNNVVPVNVMNISWSGDHRIVDGATIARFSNQLKAYLEDPEAMFLEMS